MFRSVSVSGFPGSGKSTVSKKIAAHLGLEAISAGAIMREMASSRGLSVTEMNVTAESGRDIDNRIDQQIAKVSKAGSYVFDSRMAWLFAENSLKIFLDVSADEAAIRTLSRPASKEESYPDLDTARKALFERRVSEVHRYRKYYDADLTDANNFDIFIFTDCLTPAEVFEVIKPRLSAASSAPCQFASPEALIPSQSIRELDEEHVSSIDVASSSPVQVIRHADRLFIWDGHHTVAAALLSETRVVPIKIIDIPVKGLTSNEFVASSVSKSLLFDWEDAMKITMNFDYDLFLARV